MNTLAELVAALAQAAPEPKVRFRQGQIVAVAANGTVTVTVAGGTAQITGVKVSSSCCPVPGATCWLASDGTDLFVLATLAPYGPAYATMRKSGNQSIANATWTEMTWGSRTDTAAVGCTLGTNGITVNVPGLFQVSLTVGLGGTWTTGTLYTRLLKNSAVQATCSGMPFPSSSSFVMRSAGSHVIKCAPGDILNGEIYQNAGAARDQDLAAGQNLLSVVWVGPTA